MQIRYTFMVTDFFKENIVLWSKANEENVVIPSIQWVSFMYFFTLKYYELHML